MTEIHDGGYYFSRQVEGASFEAVVAAVREALEAGGFGVMGEIDVNEVLKEKLGFDFRPYYILGVCNAPFAHQALDLEPWIGTLMPCNVVVLQRADGTIHVGALDTALLGKITGNEGLECVGEEVADGVRRVLAAL